MKQKGATLVQKVLKILQEIGEMAPAPFETPYAYIRRAGNLDRARYWRTVEHMKKRGLIRVASKAGKKFISLTSKGQLTVLLDKAKLFQQPKTWDGKWRVLIFDIPEQARQKREHLRRLLKKNGFSKLQASVFISPYPINREGVEYLKRSGLSNYIRILRVDEIDDDAQLKRKYRLK
ncbi:MAG: CRISPR-associated endonuclease Cas2 [Patescibacteria group bacterium]|nr:CRISPR-associated endonuclease Cas2 [Patescibacteria group bacterium]